jgi:hypothetical protein
MLIIKEKRKKDNDGKETLLYALCFFVVVVLRASPLLCRPLYQLSQSASHVLCWVFSRWSLSNYSAELTLNLDPPDLCLLSSWDYRHEPWHLAFYTF